MNERIDAIFNEVLDEACDNPLYRFAELVAADALAQPEQEPFGYFQLDLRIDAWVQNRTAKKGVAFYTKPPKREWVSLTDEEIHEVAIKCVKSGQSVNAAIRAIEAQLKERNNG